MIGAAVGAVLGKLKLGIMLAGVGALAVLVYFIRASGANAEKLKQAKADLRANAEIQKSRNAARTASDDELDRKVDKWTRS